MNHAFKIRTILFCFFNWAYHLWCSNLKSKILDSYPSPANQYRISWYGRQVTLPMTKIYEWFNLLDRISLLLYRDICDRIEAVSRILIRSDPELVVRLELFECCLILPTGYAADQCCGSRSKWISIDVAVLDPDPYWECESRSRSMEIYQNEQINLISCLSKRLLTYYLLNVKIPLFETI